MAYAEAPPFAGLSPATEYALFVTGAAFCCAGLETPFAVDFVVPTPGFLADVRGADGFRGIAPLIDGADGFCT